MLRDSLVNGFLLDGNCILCFLLFFCRHNLWKRYWVVCVEFWAQAHQIRTKDILCCPDGPHRQKDLLCDPDLPAEQ